MWNPGPTANFDSVMKRSPLPSSRMQSPPSFVAPQLARLARYAPAGEKWLHEIKIDGYRTGARIAGGSVSMLTRTGLDWTKRFLPIAWALAELPVRSAYFDGEIAVLGENGVSSFAALQDALSRGDSKRFVYFVFDLLFLDGRDLRELPLLERKTELAQLIKRRGRKGGPIRYSWSATAPASIARPAKCISRGSSRSCGRHPIAATGVAPESR